MNYNSKLGKAFKSIGESDSLDVLPSKIILQIGREQTKMNRTQAGISWTVSALSFAALFPIMINMLSQFQKSGFWNYFSLLFTDTGAVTAYWKEFLFSLAETTPVFQLSLALLSLLILFISLRFALKDFKRIGWSANLA
jgi:hypothetical protein